MLIYSILERIRLKLTRRLYVQKWVGIIRDKVSDVLDEYMVKGGHYIVDWCGEGEY